MIDPVAIAAGAQHTCAVRLNGQVLCWGQNSTGQLGEGIDEQPARAGPRHRPHQRRQWWRPAPPSPAPPPTTAPSSAGATTTTASSAPGTTSSGRCPRPSPSAPIRSAAGGAHSCAVGRAATRRRRRRFVCWGSDQAGQLGDNGDDRPLPAGGRSRCRWSPAAIAAGALHSCAVDASAALWCWGRGTSGQLGPGHLVDTPFPIEVALPSGADQAIAVAAGGRPQLRAGQPGRRPGRRDPLLRRQQLRPARRRHADLATDARRWSPLGPTRHARDGGHRRRRTTPAPSTSTGQPWCWGRGASGQLGDGAGRRINRRRRRSRCRAARPSAALSAGGAHTCAVDPGGRRLVCWGADDRGQLGLGAAGAGRTSPRRPPSRRCPPPPPASRPAARTAARTCGDGQRLVLGRQRQRSARRRHDRRSSAARQGRRRRRRGERRRRCTPAPSSADHVVSCWGADTSGQLGDGVTLTISAPELARVACD